MAARTRRIKHDDKTREKIQVSQLVNRLSANAMGTLKTEMSASQVKSAEILLRKSLPDLNSVELTGKDGGSLVVEIVRFADPS